MTTDKSSVRILIYNDCGTEKFLNVFFPVLLLRSVFYHWMIEVVSDTSRIHTLYVCPLNAMKIIVIRSPYFINPVAAKSDTITCTSPIALNSFPTE